MDSSSAFGGDSAAVAEPSTAAFQRYRATRDAMLLDRLINDHIGRAGDQARRLLGNAADTDDAVQEAFLQLVRTADRYDGQVPFGPWLGRLVHTACLRALRARVRHRRVLTADAGSLVSGPPPPPDRDFETLRQAVQILPERDRAAVSLHYFAGLDLRETAAALGVSLKALSVRLHRARSRLRRRLRGPGWIVSDAAIGMALASAPHGTGATAATCLAQLRLAMAARGELPTTFIHLGPLHEGVLFMSLHPLRCALIAVTAAVALAAMPVAINAAVSAPPPPPPPAAPAVTPFTLAGLSSAQSADGSWSDPTDAGVDLGASHTGLCTGLAALTFLGGGYDHLTNSRYRQTMARAMHWIVAAESGDGAFASETDVQALLTMTLCECYAITGDPALKSATESAVENLVMRRVALPDGQLAWPSDRTHISTRLTLLCTMALKSAYAAGLGGSAAQDLQDTRAWLASTWSALDDARRKAAAFPAFELIDPQLNRFIGTDPVAALALDAFVMHGGGAMRASLGAAVGALPWPAPTAIDASEVWLGALGQFMALDAPHFQAWSAQAQEHLDAAIMTSGPHAGMWRAAPDAQSLARGPVSASACALLMKEVLMRYKLTEKMTSPSSGKSPNAGF